MTPDRLRHLPLRDYHALKAATRDLVDAAGGGKRVAQLTRASEGRLSEACAAHVMDRFAAIDVVADLEAETGMHFVTRCLADLSGFDLVPRRAATRLDLHEHLARIAKECGEAQAALAVSLATPGISEAERLRTRTEMLEAIAILQEGVVAIDQVSGVGCQVPARKGDQ